MPPNDPPPYWKKACNALSRADPVMGGLISAHRGTWLSPRGDAFQTLSRAIVGQQISVKAAASIWGRVSTALHPYGVQTVRDRGAQGLCGLGLSSRKVDYLLDLARHFHETPTLANELTLMDDAAVIGRLVQIRGIGSWTAEMFLIFNLMRPDVFPVKDLGLIKAISLHYRKGRPVSAATALRIARPWAPWRSVATWYLWRSLDPLPVEY